MTETDDLKGAAKKAAARKQSAPKAGTDVEQAPSADALVAIQTPGFERALAKALPGVLTPDRFVRLCVTLMRRTPQLRACDPQTVLGALITAAQLGLEPGGPLGQCYLVPFKNKGQQEAQFMLGYRGVIALAMRSGELSTIYADVVKDGDLYTVTRGLHRDLVHEEDPAQDRFSQTTTHVYAVAHMKDGGSNFVSLTAAEVESYRKRSPTQGQNPSGPWVTDWDPMARKTAVLRLAPYLPLTAETSHGILGADEQVARWDGGDLHVERPDVIDTDEADTIEGGDAR